MNRPSGSSGDRQFGDFFLAVTCLVALGLLAVALAGGGGTLTSAAPGDGVSQSVDNTDRIDRPGLIGGGSLGGADRNPVGIAVDNETNPFQTRSGDLQFFVETDHPNYWRVDAYDEYTNGTWVRTGEYEDYRGQLPPEGSVTEEVTHQITLQRDATTLPAPWQPASITTSGDSAFAVSPETGLHAFTPVQPSSDYSISSYQYEPDLRQLRSARANYPSSIAQRYTGLPDSVPDRVTTLGDEITADAETPVGAACMIEDWMTTNTEYDHDTTHQSGADPVDQFLFEMDGGNAEYSASSMVVLLRSQDIPARYVTGYSPGEALETTNDTYAVRAVNAHAWTEVYVTGHGWIPFDPTSSTDRLAIENTAAGNGDMTQVPMPAGCSVDLDELPDDSDEQSSGDTGDESSNGTPSDENGGTDSENDSVSETGPNVTIVSDPEPLVIGGEASIKAVLDGEPMSNATVSIGAENIGTTTDNGTIEFVVPDEFAEGEVPITVRRGDIEKQQRVSVGQFRLTADPQRVLALPGQEATVIATVGSVPIEGVEIIHDGSVVGPTDENGTASVVLSAASQTTIESTYVGQQASTQIENQLLSILLVGVGSIGLVSGIGFVVKRKYAVIETTRGRASNFSERLAAAVMTAIMWLERLPAAMEFEREGKRGVWSTVVAVVRFPFTVPRRLWARRPDSIVGAILALGKQLYLSLLLVVRSVGGSTPVDSAESDPTPRSETSTRDETTSTSVRQIWSTFVRLTVRRIAPTNTPGEIAHKAIEKGFPRKPVLRLTNAFRATVYGPKRSESLVDEATDALTEIETMIPGDSTAEQRNQTNTTEDSNK